MSHGDASVLKVEAQQESWGVLSEPSLDCRALRGRWGSLRIRRPVQDANCGQQLGVGRDLVSLAGADEFARLVEFEDDCHQNVTSPSSIGTRPLRSTAVARILQFGGRRSYAVLSFT
jgi:hypothetical protein